MEDPPVAARARFDFVRYANCWEDADVLLEALDPQAGGTYLSIASAGDNSLSLLTRNPARVVAVDINRSQLACVELRKAAFRSLSYEEMLAFLGVAPSSTRWDTYLHLREQLAEETKRFWDAREPLITKGIIHIGKFERYFEMFRRSVMPLIHSRRTVERLLMARDLHGRRVFYEREWDTARWRLLFRVFFSRTVMGWLGRDPAFFTYVGTDVASRILERTRYALTELPTDQNPYLEYILTGNFQRALPRYLRREHFEPIRKHLDKLVVFRGDLTSACDAFPEVRFNGFNLSDIFEYMDEAEYEQALRELLPHAASGARLVYWNMLVPRKDVSALRGRLRFLDEEAERLFRQDKAFFYQSLVIGSAP